MAAAPDPEEVLGSTTGKDRFQRVTQLLISGGTTLLREIFDMRCPPSNLPTILNNPATVKQLKAAKLTKPQWDCLYPSPGVYGKSSDFDITLLFSLLRTICNLIPPITGWDALPASTDHSLAADMARIKYYRNSVYGHVNQSMEITDDFEFLSLWREISGALVRIAAQISPTKKREWQVTIDNFLTDPLTTEDKRNVEELQEWYRNDMEVKKSIDELKDVTNEAMDYVKKYFKYIHGMFDKNAHQIKVIEEKVQGIETAIREEAQLTKDDFEEFRQLINRIDATPGSSQPMAGPQLTNEGRASSNPQVGASEEMGQGVQIVYKSEAWVNEITLKYEMAKIMQEEVGEKILELWDTTKTSVAAYNKLATLVYDFKSNYLSTSVRISAGIFVGLVLFTLAGKYSSVFSLWFVLFLVGLVVLGLFTIKLITICVDGQVNVAEQAQKAKLIIDLRNDALRAVRTKLFFFKEHLRDIIEVCHEYPDKLIVLNECGQVSTQQVLRDVRTFLSRLTDGQSTTFGNLMEIYEEAFRDAVDTATNKEIRVIEHASFLHVHNRSMKLKTLLTAPLISTTRAISY